MDIRSNYELVRSQISQAALAVDRDPKAVRLVVVTKGHPVESIRQAAAAGARIFGENYVGEAAGKIADLAGSSDFQWHMIGHIQSRKAREVSTLFQAAHTIDSLVLAARLDRYAGIADRRLPVLLECNVSGETSKFGFPTSQEAHWEKIVPEIEQICSLPNLEVCGLMTMAPFLPDPQQSRPYFQRLCRLQHFLMERLPAARWLELSMGMSADFQIAVQEGATLVRVGTAIMGPRPFKN